MKPKNPAKRRTYSELGKFLKAARNMLYDEETGRVFRVEDMAKLLGVTPGFVYQVEQGKRKPNDGQFGKWASVYGVRYADLWKCLGFIPMDLVATLRAEAQPAAGDAFSQLTEDEKTELLSFLDYVRWKIAHQASDAKTFGSR